MAGRVYRKLINRVWDALNQDSHGIEWAPIPTAHPVGAEAAPSRSLSFSNGDLEGFGYQEAPIAVRYTSSKDLVA